MSYITREDVKITDLKTENGKDGYNRLIQPGRAKRYALEFDANAMSEIVVSERGGILHIVDGQHTVLIARLVGLEYVACKIIHGLTIQEEAKLFRTINKNRKPQTAPEDFKAAIVAEDPETIGIINVARMFGLEVADSTGRNTISAVATLKRIVKESNLDMLTLVLAIIVGAWDGEETSLKGVIINGIFDFLSTHKTAVKKDRLIKKLKEVTPIKLNAEADAVMVVGSKARRIEVAIWKRYNQKLQKGAQLPNLY